MGIKMLSITASIVAMAAAVVTQFEGLSLTSYFDPVGIPTVCYGHTVVGERQGVETNETCLLKLRLDMTAALGAVQSCQGDKLPESVAAAFTSAVYNMGSRVACASTAATYLQHGNYKAACRQLLLWDKVRFGGSLRAMRGLTARRKAEYELCLRDT